jgi:hypothetical protein
MLKFAVDLETQAAKFQDRYLSVLAVNEPIVKI